MSKRAASPRAPTRQTTRLLAGGIVAGPLFLAAWLIQAFTREGFDPTRHPLSLLSLGELGWIQIANFVVTGVLCVACAIGMWRVLHPGRSSTWGPLLVGGLGIGLILAGIFTTDPGAGFPLGRRRERPSRSAGMASSTMSGSSWPLCRGPPSVSCSCADSLPSSSGVGSEHAWRPRWWSSCSLPGPTPTASASGW